MKYYFLEEIGGIFIFITVRWLCRHFDVINIYVPHKFGQKSFLIVLR